MKVRNESTRPWAAIARQAAGAAATSGIGRRRRGAKPRDASTGSAATSSHSQRGERQSRPCRRALRDTCCWRARACPTRRARGSGRRCGGSCRGRCRAADARARCAAPVVHSTERGMRIAPIGMRPRVGSGAPTAVPSTVDDRAAGEHAFEAEPRAVLLHDVPHQQVRARIAGRAHARLHRHVVAGLDRLRKRRPQAVEHHDVFGVGRQPVIRQRERRRRGRTATSASRGSTA